MANIAERAFQKGVLMGLAKYAYLTGSEITTSEENTSEQSNTDNSDTNEVEL